MLSRRFLKELQQAESDGLLTFHGSLAPLRDPVALRALLDAARRTEWYLYAKKPYSRPTALLKYLSRYTPRIAIGDSRILAFDGETVSFRYRKPRPNGRSKHRYGVPALDVDDVISCFLLHRVPGGLRRIRHFGILANGCRKKTVAAAREALGQQTDDLPISWQPCPHCGGKLRLCHDLGRQAIGRTTKFRVERLTGVHDLPRSAPVPS